MSIRFHVFDGEEVQATTFGQPTTFGITLLKSCLTESQAFVNRELSSLSGVEHPYCFIFMLPVELRKASYTKSSIRCEASVSLFNDLV